MYVRIGPYPKWIGPHQIVDKLFFFLSEERREKIADYVPEAPFLWMEKHFRQRHVDVKINNYDVWNMDDTLAKIILPMLVKLKEQKPGAPYVDLADVPTNFRIELTEEQRDSGNVDEHHFARWDWIIDEMIWTFEQLNTDWEEQYVTGEADYNFDTKDEMGNGIMTKGPNHTLKLDNEGMEVHRKRIENGLRLFGKYYQSLWC